MLMAAPDACVVTEIAAFRLALALSCPFFVAPVRAGFPSPAEDYVERALDLNEFLVPHPTATFFARVKGDSMEGVGIHDGDTLVVDRSLSPRDGQIVIALVNNKFTVKRLRRTETGLLLVAENPTYHALAVTPQMGFEMWGVVTYVIHPV
jgi:DNA polymerase V